LAYEFASERLRQDPFVAGLRACLLRRRGRSSDSQLPEAWNWPFNLDLPEHPDVAATVILTHGIVEGWSSMAMDSEAFLSLGPVLQADLGVLLAFVVKVLEEKEYQDDHPLRPLLVAAESQRAPVEFLADKIRENPLDLILGPSENAEPSEAKREFGRILGENAVPVAATVAWMWSEKGAKSGRAGSIPPALWSDRCFARVALRGRYAEAYPHVPLVLLENPAFMVGALKSSVTELPECLRSDLLLMRALMAIPVNEDRSARSAQGIGTALKLFSPALRADRAFVHSLVRSGVDCLGDVSDELRNDRAVVLDSCFRHPESMCHASAALRDDEAFALQVLQDRASWRERAWPTLSPRLRGLWSVAEAALERSACCYKNASEELQSNREFIVQALARDWRVFDDLPESERGADEIVEACAAAGGGRRLGAFPMKYRMDQEFVRDCVAQDGSSFEGACEQLRADADYVAMMAKISLRALEYVIKDVAREASALTVATKRYRDRQIIMTIIPEPIVRDHQYRIEKLWVSENGVDLLTARRMTLLEYADHGPVGSYLSLSSTNFLTLAGSFLFYVSLRGIDATGPRANGRDFDEGLSELWLVDLAAAGVDINLRRSYENNEKAGRAFCLDSDAGMTLLAKGADILIPTGVGLDSKCADLHQCLLEMAESGASDVFTKYGSVEGDRFILHSPKLIDACGAAASVQTSEFGRRWLFPRDDGFYTWADQRARLAATGHRDEWLLLKSKYLAGSKADDRHAVLLHYQRVADGALEAEVKEYLRTSGA